MASNSRTERLTPLDLLMPRTYIAAALTFQMTDSTSEVIKTLQSGVDDLCKQLPYLKGHVFPTTATEGQKPGLELRWDINGPAPAIIDKGTIPTTHAALFAKGLPPTEIPDGVWPVSAMIDDAAFQTGVPVFAASVFRFADGAVGLCVCLHHNTVDATGYSDVLRLLAHVMCSEGQRDATLATTPTGRCSRLSDALSAQLAVASSLSTNELFAKHPEYSASPPVFSTEALTAKKSCKVFRLQLSKIDSIKATLGNSAISKPTTNTVVCALLWAAVTRARLQRLPDLGQNGTCSKLITAVNGRSRVEGKTLSSVDDPYLGNTILYALTEKPFQVLGSGMRDSPSNFGAFIDAIVHSEEPANVGAQAMAELHCLASGMADYRTVFPGWDLFGSRDLVITSWANLGIYDLDFGRHLGRPAFVRVHRAEADGVSIVLPRNRRAGVGEVIDVMLMLREEDMKTLEEDEEWKAVCRESNSGTDSE